jgi:hypothetical protein
MLREEDAGPLDLQSRVNLGRLEGVRNSASHTLPNLGGSCPGRDANV